MRTVKRPPVHLATVKAKEAWLELAVRGRHLQEVALRAHGPHAI
jgi:hypothetical protein